MIAPKFSLRQLFLIFIGVAAVCSLLGFAARGSMMAYGLGVAILGSIVPFFLYGAVYWAAYYGSALLLGDQVKPDDKKPSRPPVSSGSNGA